MDLKSGCIFWRERDGDGPLYPVIDRDIACDVAIIGSGITGALSAYFASRAGMNSVLLDRRPICSGSTPASTGLLQYEIDTRLTKLTGMVGKQPAQGAYRLSVESLDAFAELVEDLDDSCDLVARPSLYLACEGDDVAELRAEQAARRAIGIDVQFLNESDLRRDFSISRPAALWSRRAMEVDPYRLALSLLRRSASLGTQIYERSCVDDYQVSDDSVKLRMAGGASVRASYVIFATGYETPHFLGPQICSLKSTYAMATEPTDLSAWRDRCLIWESGKPYFYARTTSDGRALVGGEDEDFADAERRDALIESKSRVLARKLEGLLPGIRVRSDCCWAGTFAESRDGLPYIGTHPKFPRGYFALGYGGNGITFSLVAARIIHDLIAGRPNPDAAIFRFDR